MTQRLPLILLLFMAHIYAFGQLPPDEIALIKNRLKTAGTDSARFTTYMDLSLAYRYSNIDSSIYYTDKALQLSRMMRSRASEAAALSQMGYIVLETGNIPLSLQYQLKALHLIEQFSDPVVEGFTLNRTGNVYAELEEYPKAITYYRMAIDKFSKANQQGYIHNELSNIGAAYDGMNRLDSAKIYQQKVYAYSLTNTDRYAITYGEMRLRFGNVEARLGNDEAALMHYRAGVAEALRDVDMNNLAFLYLQMAKLFTHLKLYDSGFVYVRKAIETANPISFKRAVYEASGLLASLFKGKGQPDSALIYAELSAAVKDSLFGQKKIQELQRILLDEQQRQQQLQDERNRLQERNKRTALAAVLGISFIVGVILFINNRQKQKANKILQDTLTDLKAAQQQLIQSEKMASLGELTAGIAHEIQNPLNFVNNFSDVNNDLIDEMRENIDNGNTEEAKTIAADVKENNTKISHHGKRADAIVKGMLQHSRASTGKKELTDINAIADEYLRLSYHGLRAKDKSFDANFKTSFDESVGKIEVVPHDIGRVLLNLYNNAFYAVNEKRKGLNGTFEPTVFVSTKRSGNKVEISVRDNGTGISQKVVDKIFQPFFTTKPTGQGTGLGLSLCYDIVRAHGGEIKVESKEGEGSFFVINIPTM